MLRKLFAAGAAALLTIAVAGAAQAAKQHMTISNGVFTDGGTVSGWFNFNDACCTAPTAWDIVTTGGSTLAGDEYKSGGANQSAINASLLGVFPAFDFLHGPASGPDDLELTFVTPAPGDAFETQEPCAGCLGPVRLGSFDYQMTAVPEPGAWTLTILGLGLAGAALRRRRTLLRLCAQA